MPPDPGLAGSPTAGSAGVAEQVPGHAQRIVHGGESPGEHDAFVGGDRLAERLLASCGPEELPGERRGVLERGVRPGAG